MDTTIFLSVLPDSNVWDLCIVGTCHKYRSYFVDREAHCSLSDEERVYFGSAVVDVKNTSGLGL
jgi:hypothetical protein